MTTGGFYAVKVGRKKGIYLSWDDCKVQVHGYQGSVYKKFKTKIEATAFMNNGNIGYNKITPPSIDSHSMQSSLEYVATPIPLNLVGSPKAPLYNTSKSTSISSQSIPTDNLPSMFCRCDIQSIKQKVQKEGDNKGREFYSCKDRKCHFFQWANDIIDNDDNITNTKSTNNLTINKNDKKQQSLNYSDHYLNAMNRDDTIILYIDGSCPNNVNVANRHNNAGFGCVAVKNDTNIDDKDKTCLCQLYGPVVLDVKSKYYIGATLGSNNTGELTAIGEALLWIQQFVPSSSPIILRYDSEYAAKSTLGIFNGEKNKDLVLKVQRLYKDVLLQRKNRIVKSSKSSTRLNGEGLIILKHVKAHSGDYLNDLVDKLAKDGALGEICNEGRYKVNSPVIEPQQNLMKTIINNQKKIIDNQIKNSSFISYVNSISNQIVTSRNKELNIDGDFRSSFHNDSESETEVIQIDLTDEVIDDDNNKYNNRILNNNNKDRELNKRNIQVVDLTINSNSNNTNSCNSSNNSCKNKRRKRSFDR
jgi:viroplasmin and RNaseH domain-containing protein/ribonuclease HI